MGAVTLTSDWPAATGPLTVADLERTPDDGRRYELVDGVLTVSPAPLIPHQVVLLELAVTLRSACPEDLELVPGPGLRMSDLTAAACCRDTLAQYRTVRHEHQEGRLPTLRHPVVLDPRAGSRPARHDRLRAEGRPLRAGRARQRGRRVPGGAAVPGQRGSFAARGQAAALTTARGGVRSRGKGRRAGSGRTGRRRSA